jgi:hypothetical protein
VLSGEPLGKHLNDLMLKDGLAEIDMGKPDEITPAPSQFSVLEDALFDEMGKDRERITLTFLREAA